MNLLLRNTTSVTLYPSKIEALDIRISNGVITERGKNLQPKRDDEVHDLKGKIILPGMVNAHTHLYSSLSRGMPAPRVAPKNFYEILKKIWWRLDRALDEETIYYSALVGAIEAVKCGTTTIIDHHASPNAIKGSLNIIKEALDNVGTRGVLCYEVTDRGGKKQRDEGLEENEQFIRSNKTNSSFRGLVGAHASFTLSDESLRLCGEVANSFNTGVHIHVAEDVCDVADAKKNYNSTIIERLAKHHILNSQTILAHCIHVTKKDFAKLNKTKCFLAHNPRSNMNNKVGHASIHLFRNRGMLGTDGFPADIFEESKLAFFKRQDSQYREAVDFAQLITGGQRYVSELFGKQFGAFTKNSVADFIVLDYVAPTPMTKDNILGHFLFGMQSAHVSSVMIGGKWIVRDRKVLSVDVGRIYSAADSKSKKMWIKMMETVP